MTLDQCHRVGQDLLLHLLTVPPLLSSLHCWSCSNINSVAQHQILEHIQHNNLDVNFQWLTATSLQQKTIMKNFVQVWVSRGGDSG